MFMSGEMMARGGSFLGGVRWRNASGLGGNATWPLVRLRIEAGWVVIEPSAKLVRAFMAGTLPTWRFPCSAIQRAERVRGPLFGSPGVRLVTDEQSPPLIFWSYAPEDVLRALAAQGVAVDFEIHRAPLIM
jgi:hypothetical protein